jgi:hypothetical protein
MHVREDGVEIVALERNVRALDQFQVAHPANVS